MFSLEVHYQVGQEKIRDLRRDAAHYQLIQTAGPRQLDNRESFRNMSGWFVSQLTTWRAKLPHYGHSQQQSLTQRG